MKLPAAIPEPELTPREGLLLAFELFQFGEDLMRQNFRRAHPGDSEAEIEVRVAAWLQEQPGLESGVAGARRCRRVNLPG